MHRAIVISFALFLVPSALAGETIAFDVGGLRMGDKLTKEFAYSHCPAKNEGKAERICHKIVKMDGGDVFVRYYFDEFKLVGVTFSYRSSMFGEVLSAYRNKFGQPPHDTQREPVVTKMGVQYLNEIKSWTTDSGEFVVRKYGGSVDKGYAYIRSPEYEKYLLKKKTERQRKLGSQL